MAVFVSNQGMRMNLMILLTVVLLGACSSSSRVEPTDAGGDASAPEVAFGDGALAADGASDAVDSPANRALSWVLGALNGGALTETDVAARFTSTFLSQVTVAQVIEVLTQLAAQRPWMVVRLEGPVTDRTLVAVVTNGAQLYGRVVIATDAAGRFQALVLQAAGDLDPALASWQAIDSAVSALAPRANMMAATIDDAGCTPTHALAADTNLALGSTFKLWILAALAQDVDAGKYAWTDTVPIVDAHKSLPPGVLHDEPSGTAVPLLALANNMIAISDNTAADHLLFFLGRETVEAMLAATAHHDPSVNQPFLGTRDLFTLKLMVTPTEQQAYIAATVAQRRLMLAEFDAAYDPRNYQGPAWNAPRAIDTLEWFATPGDLCNVMHALKAFGDKETTRRVDDVLAINPGIPDTTGAFSYVGFKGGSEPGVLNMTWLLRRKSDQKWLFFTIAFNDRQKAIDEDQAVYLAAAARALLAAP